jgi:protein TonB
MKTLLLAIVLGYASLTARAQKNNQVNSIAEQMPEYPGGEEALFKFLLKNIHFPDEATNQTISTTVRVKFIINENGIIDSVHCDKEYEFGLADEAMRVVKMMPKWIPGQNNGRAVAVRCTLPIRFVGSKPLLQFKKRKNRHSLI